MFSGIVACTGRISHIAANQEGLRLTVRAHALDPSDVALGDSIAVSGACLTAVTLDGKNFTTDVSPETVSRTTFAKAVVGERVNLERALRLSDRLDGHLVSGHIDGMGVIRNRKTLDNAIIVTIGVPESLSRYMIPKGSVAIDGISLTINRLDKDSFDVSIIPHTAKLTTISFKKVGDSVNIETDMIGKYVERFVSGNKQSGVTMELLVKNGFL